MKHIFYVFLGISNMPKDIFYVIFHLIKRNEIAETHFICCCAILRLSRHINICYNKVSNKSSSTDHESAVLTSVLIWLCRLINMYYHSRMVSAPIPGEQRHACTISASTCYTCICPIPAERVSVLPTLSQKSLGVGFTFGLAYKNL